jgi:putative ABC transport system permease protein
MLQNYLMVAWRHLFKNKLYAGINILGLMVGLSIFLFGSLIVEYERNYDSFFDKADRIYTVGTVFSPTAAQNVGVGQLDGIYTGFGPIIETAVPEVEAVARTVRQEFLLSIDDNHFYEPIRFTDPALLQIFNFNYIGGDATALEDPSGVVITQTLADKLFGRTDVVGEALTLDRDVSMYVAAVIEDLPKNSHLKTTILTQNSEIFAPLAALDRAIEWDLAGNWGNLSMGNLTYVLAPADKDMAWVQGKMDEVFTNHYPEPDQEFIAGLRVRTVSGTNEAFFDALGLPILDSVRVLGLMVLIIAIVNYTNLATAQSLGRAREVGLRKTMGASRSQLLIQFLVESLCTVGIAMLLSLALLEFILPKFNEFAGRALELNYALNLPFLAITTILVGLVAGGYPAYLITRASPIDALHESKKQAGSSLFRNSMLGLQFTISIFMLAMVMVVFFQNQKIANASDLYPRSQIISLQRLDVESIRSRLDTLKNELRQIPGVEGVSFSSQLPFEQSNSSFEVGSVQGDPDSAIMMMNISVDEDFMEVYEIPLLAGRQFDTGISSDRLEEDELAVNVLANEMALEKLGLGNPQQALGKAFYDYPDEDDERGSRAYTIVGVVPDQNIQGFHNSIKPMFFLHQTSSLRAGSVKVAGARMDDTLVEIEAVWKEIVPGYPLQSEYLDEVFDEVFEIYTAMTTVLAAFALVALTLSMIGLFGLAAFVAQSRTREIGIRKVMGATVSQIVRLLVWQFSKPVMWSLLVALPLTWFAAGTYLDFFANRIEMPAGVIGLAGLLAVLFSWGVVSLHAIRVARANPISALRYE